MTGDTPRPCVSYPEAMDPREIEDRYGTGVYAKRNLVIVRGLGAKVWDQGGREYIDCVAGIGVANVGHCNPAVVQAICRQSARLITCNELFYNDCRAELLLRLARIAPPGIDRFFLCNSGAEAVEAAIKFSRMATGRKRIIAAMRGYHGKSFGALSATWEKKYRDPFVPLVPDFSHIPYNNTGAALRAIDAETAAVILEPVQGEGGVRPGDPEFFRAVRRACDERGALLIVDEIQTGMGRTGRVFACQHFGIAPDILAMAKGVAGGIPMGVIGVDRRVNPIEKQSHTSTFGGNPLAAAAAVAAIDYLLEHDLPARAAELGAHFLEGLRKIRHPQIREVRGLGLMIGIELKTKAGPYAQALMDEGVLALLAGTTVLRFLPPLVITREEIDVVIAALARVLASPPRATAE